MIVCVVVWETTGVGSEGGGWVAIGGSAGCCGGDAGAGVLAGVGLVPLVGGDGAAVLLELVLVGTGCAAGADGGVLGSVGADVVAFAVVAGEGGGGVCTADVGPGGAEVAIVLGAELAIVLGTELAIVLGAGVGTVLGAGAV
ncbi:MAG TPA: hypothetical protein VMF57_07460 [Solirubrobacteraceae bacterium]|nr:hypothetical protein [Solirubrobacteraceae bacterium]